MDDKEKSNEDLLNNHYALARALAEHRKIVLGRLGVTSDPRLRALEDDSIFGVDRYAERRSAGENTLLRALNKVFPQGSRRNTQPTAKGKRVPTPAPERGDGRAPRPAQVRLPRITPSR